MNKERKISIIIVLSVLLLSVFFFYEATSLVINGDFTRFFPWDEMDDVYYVESDGGESGLTASANIETDYIVSSDYRTGLVASLDTVAVEEEKDYPYTSTMYVLVSFPDLWKSEYISTLENCIDEIEKRRDSARPQPIFGWITIKFGAMPTSWR